MARNIDKIKELEYELGRWRKKAAEQQEQIRQLKSEAEDAWDALMDINHAADSVLCNVALKFGEQADGGYKNSIPMPSVSDIMRDYEVSTGRDKEHGLYVVFVKQKPKEN